MFRSWGMEIPEATLKLFQLQQTLHLEDQWHQVSVGHLTCASFS